MVCTKLPLRRVVADFCESAESESLDGVCDRVECHRDQRGTKAVDRGEKNKPLLLGQMFQPGLGQTGIVSQVDRMT